MTVSLQIESPISAVRGKANELVRFARRARTAVGLKGTVSIVIESNERMQAMNRHFRRKNKPTDVLSFPPAASVAKIHSGDIAISADIAAVNAKMLGHSVVDEIKVLLLHGMLHLAGYDHETDSGEMAAQEAKLHIRLRLPDSMTGRSGNLE